MFLVACLALAPAVQAADLDARVQRLERMLSAQNQSDIVLQLQQLQRELQQLRGQLEMQQHALKKLERQQREQYLDLDGRLSANPPTPAGGPAAPAEGAAAGPAAAASETGQPAVGGDPKQERAEYDRAFRLLQQAHYKQATEAFQGFLERYPASEYADNARYWLGETSYVMRDLPTALEDFNRLLTDYPASRKVPDAMLKIGYIHAERKEWDRARTVLEQLERNHPGTTAARLAKERLEAMSRDGH
jgi:tol-pal system protein YbgF